METMMDRSLLLVSAETLATLIEDIRRPSGTRSRTSVAANSTKLRSRSAELDQEKEQPPEPRPLESGSVSSRPPSDAGAGVYSRQPSRSRGLGRPSKFSSPTSRLTDLGKLEEKTQTQSPLDPSNKEPRNKEPRSKDPRSKDPRSKDPRSIPAEHVVPHKRSDNSEQLLAPLAEVSDRIERLQHTFQRADGINSRIALGLRWIVGGSGALAAFIADADGLALANHQAPEAYIAVSPDLASVQDTLNAILPRPVEGALVVSVDEHNLLQLLFTTTAIGRLAVGLVVTEPLPAPEICGIRNIVRAATQPTEPHARTA